MMADFEVKHSMRAGGDGWPTAEELIGILKALPPKAKPDFRRHDSQREGTSWTLTAEWDEATQQAWKPPAIQYPPGARGPKDESYPPRPLTGHARNVP
jgi:hypothetical protein